MLPTFKRLESGPAEQYFRDRYPPGALWVATEEIETVHEQGRWNGETVNVEGIGPCEVLAVERFMHAPPWTPGEKTGLVVMPANRDE